MEYEPERLLIDKLPRKDEEVSPSITKEVNRTREEIRKIGHAKK